MIIISNIIVAFDLKKCCFNWIHPNYNQFDHFKPKIGHYNSFLNFTFEFHHFKKIRFISIKQ